MDWLQQKKLQARVFWDYMHPVRKGAKMYSWMFGGPLIAKGAKLGYNGLGKAFEGLEWTKNTIVEGGLGAMQATVAPFWMLAKSRLITVKRFMWDVPIATFSAAWRTPIALAASPLRAARATRDAIKNLPGNAKEVLNQLRQFDLRGTIGSTRKALGDLFWKPVDETVRPIVSPAANVVGKGFGAEWQTVTTARQAVAETIPGGIRRFWNAPRTSSMMLAQARAERAARRAALLKERDEKDAKIKQAVAAQKGDAADTGEGEKAGGLKKKAA